jgi:hypothetical protein
MRPAHVIQFLVWKTRPKASDGTIACVIVQSETVLAVFGWETEHGQYDASWREDNDYIA